MRVITERQFDQLISLGSAAAGLSWRKRETEMFLRRGWVTADWQPPYYQWVRITAEGLRALAQGVERYELPRIGPEGRTTIRVCSECGSTRYHHEPRTAEQMGVQPVVKLEVPA